MHGCWTRPHCVTASVSGYSVGRHVVGAGWSQMSTPGRCTVPPICIHSMRCCSVFLASCCRTACNAVHACSAETYALDAFARASLLQRLPPLHANARALPSDCTFRRGPQYTALSTRPASSTRHINRPAKRAMTGISRPRPSPQRRLRLSPRCRGSSRRATGPRAPRPSPRPCAAAPR
jgi:hypothetical protein